MFEKNFYTIQSIANELQVDESQVREWQDQYESWIPYAGHGRNKVYPKMALDIMQIIAEATQARMSSIEIEDILNKEFQMVTTTKDVDTQVPKQMSDDTNEQMISITRLLIENLSLQQKRIATAQERHAAAEEQKVAALLKRAEAEMQKANALNSIARALQGKAFNAFNEDINQSPQSGPIDFPEESSIGIQQQASVGDKPGDVLKDAFTEESSPEAIDALQEAEPTLDLNNLTMLIDEFSAATEDPSESAPQIGDETPIEHSGLNPLLPEPDHDLTDLASLIPETDQSDLSALNKHADPEPAHALADLESLLPESDQSDAPEQNDLSALTRHADPEPAHHLTDLASLISEPASGLADLEALAAETAENHKDIASNLADLSQLTQEDDATAPPGLTDLSQLVESPDKPATQNNDTTDLIDLTEPHSPSDADKIKDTNAPPKKVAAPPPPKMEKGDYKKKMMALIITMKEKQGLSSEETARQLNEKGYRTISGSGTWNKTMIEKIYIYIDQLRHKIKK